MFCNEGWQKFLRGLGSFGQLAPLCPCVTGCLTHGRTPGGFPLVGSEQGSGGICHGSSAFGRHADGMATCLSDLFLRLPPDLPPK